MQIIDMDRFSARISMKDVAAGKRWVSNPAAFEAFMAGVNFNATTHLDSIWRLPPDIARRNTLFLAIVSELLPSVYDVRHLESLGGRFALRITGIGDYTVTALNRRIVTFTNLPVDEATSEPVIDVEIRADVFLAVINELVFNAAQGISKFAPENQHAHRDAAAVQHQS